MRGLNLAVKFLLEIVAFAGLGVWGWQAAGWFGVVVTPAAAVALWGLLAAPKANHRLPLAARVPFELGVFATAASAWWASGHAHTAALFAVLAAVNAVGLTVWRQWEY